MLKIEKELQLTMNEWLLDQSADAVLFIDMEGRILAANDTAVQFFHLTDDRQSFVEEYLFIEEHFTTESKEIVLTTKVEPAQDVLVKSMEMDGLICLVIKNSQFNEKEGLLSALYEKVEDGPSEGIILHDHGTIVDCDFAFASMLGYERNELIGVSILKLIHPQDRDKLLFNTQVANPTPYSIRGIRKDGKMVYGEILPEKISQNDKNLRISVVRNVTERVLNEKKIEFMAYYDELTDLPNRNYFQKVIQDEIGHLKNKQQKVAVHLIDIDYFKQINDTMGYHFGDLLLQACASRLKHLLMEDVFIARMTSDEFVIMQRNVTSNEEIEQFARKMIDLFKKPLIVDEYEIFSTVSVGISIYPDLANTTNELLKQADAAMHACKKDQLNGYKFYKPSITKGFKERLALETELHKAIQQQDFELHYQPQIDIQTEQIIGFEALCRWNHPERGFIPPTDFIPLAEKTGLILELGEWVLYEACRQNKAWQDMGLPKVKVSVNLSAKQFITNNLVGQVKRILQETGLEPEYLELEITESMAMANEDYIIETLTAFQELGVKVALDDFGTGYSSLRYLSQFPLSKIKIDRVFIQDHTQQNAAIVKTIISLSRALNLRVIAEGVERKQDMELLLREKCDEVQGYYFSKPLPAVQVMDIFKTKKWSVS